MRVGRYKTSDFFEANIRTFDAKHPYFCPEKSDVSDFRKRTVEEKLLNPDLTDFTDSTDSAGSLYIICSCSSVMTGKSPQPSVMEGCGDV